MSTFINADLKPISQCLNILNPVTYLVFPHYFYHSASGDAMIRNIAKYCKVYECITFRGIDSEASHIVGVGHLSLPEYSVHGLQLITFRNCSVTVSEALSPVQVDHHAGSPGPNALFARSLAIPLRAPGVVWKTDTNR